MNIHFPQTERKPQLGFQLLMACVACALMMLAFNVSRRADVRFSMPTISIQVVQPVNSDLPVAIPAPLPPAEATQAIATPEPTGNTVTSLAPQAIPAPAPSVP